MKLLIGKRGEEKEGSEIHSLFRLIGKNEDALTYSLGYLLSKNIDFLVEFLKICGVLPRKRGAQYQKNVEGAEVRLQELRDRSEGGRKDITIERRDYLRVVIEAKVDGSIPSSKQLAKYSVTHGSNGVLDPKFVHKEWGSFKDRHLLTLTRAPVPKSQYSVLRKEIQQAGIGIQIRSVQWCDISGLVDRWKRQENGQDLLWHQLLKEFRLFLKEDYKVKYFEEEVIHVHVLKNLIYPMCNIDPLGYYFDGKPDRKYRKSLFFVPCYGQARKATKTAEFIRYIDNYELLSGPEILKRQLTDPMRKAFEEQVAKWPEDKRRDRIHVFTLGAKIPIPVIKQKFSGPNRGYNKIDFFLSS